ncbi:MAG: MG2 domain-containing protein [Thermoproteota archaeon]
MGQPALTNNKEHEIVVELTLWKLAILILLIIPVIVLAYVGVELMSAYYGSRSFIIDFSLDKEVYKLGDWVTVSVSVYTGGLGGLIKTPAGRIVVGIEVRNPKGGIAYVNQGDTSLNGTLEFRFRISREAEAGEYTVYLACTGGFQSGKFRVEP